MSVYPLHGLAPVLELPVTEQVADVLAANGFPELTSADIARLHYALCDFTYGTHHLDRLAAAR